MSPLHCAVHSSCPVFIDCSRDSDWAGWVMPLLNSVTQDRELEKQVLRVSYQPRNTGIQKSRAVGGKRVTGNGRHRLGVGRNVRESAENL